MIKFDLNHGYYVGQKDTMFYHIRKISEKNLGIFSGSLRIFGSSSFRHWFHFDTSRPRTKKNAHFRN